MHKGVALLLLAVTVLAGFKNLHSSFALNLSDWHMQKRRESLRVMTWNVQDFINFYPRNNPESKPRLQMFDLITQYNPDILCVQEFRNETGRDFASAKEEVEALGYHYVYISNDSIVPFYGPFVIYSGSAIFSKLPFADSARVNIRHKDVNENMVYADVMLDNKRLRVFTGHLASLNLYMDTITGPRTGDDLFESTYKRKHRIESLFRIGEITHQGEAEIIRRQLDASPYPAIYCGDNNATPTSYTYYCLKGDRQDAFLKKGFGLGGTFYKLSPTLRIDVCLVSTAFEVLQCTVPQVKLSDHYPVVTDITWGKN